LVPALFTAPVVKLFVVTNPDESVHIKVRPKDAAPPVKKMLSNAVLSRCEHTFQSRLYQLRLYHIRRKKPLPSVLRLRYSGYNIRFCIYRLQKDTAVTFPNHKLVVTVINV